MTDPVKEQLSACLDGELPRGELDLLLKQVNRDPETRATLGRYALISEALRAPDVVAAPTDFSRRVAAAIAEQAPLDTPNRSARRPAVWLRPAAGFAVAAGVAAVAIMALQQPSEDAAIPLADTSTSPPAPTTVTDDSRSASYIVPANTVASGYVPAARLTNYVVAHSEYSGPLGRRSVLSGVLAEEEPNGETAAEPEASEAEASQATDNTAKP